MGNPSFLVHIHHPSTPPILRRKNLRMCWTFPPVSLLRLLEHLAMAIFGFWVQAPLTWAPRLKNSPEVWRPKKIGGSVIRLELKTVEIFAYTLQGTNISHLGKRKIIFKMPFFGGYVSSLEGISPVWIGFTKWNATNPLQLNIPYIPEKSI